MEERSETAAPALDPGVGLQIRVRQPGRASRDGAHALWALKARWRPMTKW